MVWTKEEIEGYEHIARIKAYMLDCIVCSCPITRKEKESLNDMCPHCHAETMIRKDNDEPK